MRSAASSRALTAIIGPPAHASSSHSAGLEMPPMLGINNESLTHQGIEQKEEITALGAFAKKLREG